MQNKEKQVNAKKSYCDDAMYSAINRFENCKMSVL